MPLKAPPIASWIVLVIVFNNDRMSPKPTARAVVGRRQKVITKAARRRRLALFHVLSDWMVCDNCHFIWLLPSSSPPTFPPVANSSPPSRMESAQRERYRHL